MSLKLLVINVPVTSTDHGSSFTHTNTTMSLCQQTLWYEVSLKIKIKNPTKNDTQTYTIKVPGRSSGFLLIRPSSPSHLHSVHPVLQAFSLLLQGCEDQATSEEAQSTHSTGNWIFFLIFFFFNFQYSRLWRFNFRGRACSRVRGHRVWLEFNPA